MGNQWSFISIDEMWSNLRVCVSIRAVTFWASWSLFSCFSVIPQSKAFPLSNREVTRAWTRVAAASLSRILRILLMFLIWKYADLQTFLMWSSIDKVLSNIIPKLRALGEAWIGVDTIWKQELVGLDWRYYSRFTLLIPSSMLCYMYIFTECGHLRGS